MKESNGLLERVDLSSCHVGSVNKGHSRIMSASGTSQKHVETCVVRLNTPVQFGDYNKDNLLEIIS